VQLQSTEDFVSAVDAKSLRHFVVPSADLAGDNRVQAISPAAKTGIPVRFGHARGHASALGPYVADP